MSVWLFQASGDYDLVRRVQDRLGKSDWWGVRQHYEKLKQCDIALFWQSGDMAGIYAIGELTSGWHKPNDDQETDDEWVVDVRYDKLLNSPILRTDLMADETLRHLDIVRRPRSKNPYSVSDDQWVALENWFRSAAQNDDFAAETAQLAGPIHGDELYQQRARAAFPLLVRQAEVGTPISYSDLAGELKMANARNLNYVLGSIGQTIEKLSEEWGEAIPPIQCLVVNKNTELPGDGIGWFLQKKEVFAALSRRRKQAIVKAQLQRIFAYRRWRDVLNALSLEPAEFDFSSLVAAAGQSSGNGGEGPEHNALKNFVANNPETVGLPSGSAAGVTEFHLPSGDCLDVSFNRKSIWLAVEVKSSISCELDIVRGMFQCIKYSAVMEAKLIADARQQDVRVVLGLESALPSRLIALKNLLGVEVIDEITCSTRENS